MNIECGRVAVAGYYTFFLNGEKVFEAPSKNLITDFGWNRIMNIAMWQPGQIQVGTSNTPPAVTDVALGAFVAEVTPSGGPGSTGTDANGEYSATTTTGTFAVGAVVGNIAEVGYKVQAGDSSLMSRSLVKDATGNPAVIVVTAADQLVVQFQLRYYRSALDLTGNITVAGVPTTYVFRTGTKTAGTTADGVHFGGFTPIDVDVEAFGGDVVFGPPGVAPSGGTNTSSGGLSITSLVVDSNTGVVSYNLGPVATSSGNLSGGTVCINIRNMGPSSTELGAYGQLKVQFTPPIPKDDTKILTYSFSYTFTRL